MQKTKNIILIFFILLLIGIFFNNTSEYVLNVNDNYNKEENNKKIEVKYYSSIDGDTAKFKLNEKIIKVRFLGIDAPETPQSPREEGYFWEEASNFTKEKLENANKVEIEYDENALQKDKYERDLTWVWVDNKLLQEELVSNGLAKTYMLQENYKYANILKQAENNAKNKKLGIWNIKE